MTATGLRPGASRPPNAGIAFSLTQEHATLATEVRVRALAVISESEKAVWPHAGLAELINYLQLEVLQQCVDEERWLFRVAQNSPPDLDLLRDEHLQLRLAIEGLVQAAASHDTPSPLSPHELAVVTKDLVVQLEAHLAREEAMTDFGVNPPAMSSLGARPHEWYTLTEGRVLDLDLLPGKQGVEAVFARLLRLEPGEDVDLRCNHDPSRLCQQLLITDAGGYGVEYLERGPTRWQVHITRRAADWTPHPFA